MNIDKLIRAGGITGPDLCFGSLMNIDKLILYAPGLCCVYGFGSLMNIDKLIRFPEKETSGRVLVL